jgi:PHD/YefM family antitoxin component YafN of YafNO toxin-antitoxin module
MKITLTQLRANIFKLIDQVLETGTPLEIERKGRRLKIIPEQEVSKMDKLIARDDFVKGDLDDFIHLDWSDQWRP